MSIFEFVLVTYFIETTSHGRLIILKLKEGPKFCSLFNDNRMPFVFVLSVCDTKRSDIRDDDTRLLYTFSIEK